MGKNTFIEINGKKYDALTGKLIDGAEKPVVNSPSVQPKQNTGAVDGFVKHSGGPKSERTPAKHASKSPQKSQTLMRNSVSKPKAVTTAKEKPKHSSLKRKLGLSPHRARHAKEVSKSSKISKYEHTAARSSVVKKHEAVPVKQPPAHHDHATQTPKHVQKTPTHAAKPHADSHKKPHNNSIASSKLIEAALANSNSHNEPHHHKSKKQNKFTKKLGISSRTAAVSSVMLAIVLLAGFFAVQNVPNLAMRVASTRAGFDASMPGYQPSGFSFNGPINYSSGRVTVSFTSNSDERQYDFTQSSSNWNSDALLANYIIAEDKQYQTYQDRDRTLYIYDGSNATWVDNGVWYQIEGDSKMTTDQLIRIASSI